MKKYKEQGNHSPEFERLSGAAKTGFSQYSHREVRKIVRREISLKENSRNNLEIMYR